MEITDLISVSDALSFFPSLIVDAFLEKKVRNGVKLTLKTNEERTLLRSLTNEPLAIYEKRDDGLYHSLRGLF